MCVAGQLSIGFPKGGRTMRPASIQPSDGALLVPTIRSVGRFDGQLESLRRTCRVGGLAVLAPMSTLGILGMASRSSWSYRLGNHLRQPGVLQFWYLMRSTRMVGQIQLFADVLALRPKTALQTQPPFGLPPKHTATVLRQQLHGGSAGIRDALMLFSC